MSLAPEALPLPAMGTIRRAAGLTQDAVATHLDVSRDTVRAWEQGKTYPPLDRAAALATLYRCWIEDLL